MLNSCLNNIHVLVTRPGTPGEKLCQAIVEEGGLATHLPAIEFGPPKDRAALQQAIAAIPEQDWLIFISPQAVHAYLGYTSLPSQVKIAAVGAGTARRLAEAGATAVLYPATEWSSQGLLDLPVFQHMTGRHITIVRGEGGREILAETMAARGAVISHMIVYQRLCPTNAALFAQCQDKIQAVICTSGEAVTNIKHLVGKHIPLIVISERIKRLARDLGFQTIWVARNASHLAMLEVLITRKDELCLHHQQTQSLAKPSPLDGSI